MTALTAPSLQRHMSEPIIECLELSEASNMRVLYFSLAVDADDPILGFTGRWIRELAGRVEFVHVITMSAGRVEVPGNVRIYSVGKERG
jgi:hypothetical protein